MSRSSKILVVTNGPLARNPRVVKESTTLANAGYDVTVLSIRNHAPSEPLDRELTRGLNLRHEQLDMLPGGGLAVFRRRLALWIARDAAKRFGWKSIHSLGPANALLARMKSLPADLTIVHNEVPHWAGTRLLAMGRRVVADIEDWHSEDLLPADRLQRPLSTIREVERTLLQKCATTTTSHALAEGLHARYGGRRPTVVTNSFLLQPDPHRPQANRVPSFFWFSQTLGPGRGLEVFLRAWQLTTTPSQLVLLGDDRGDYARTLLSSLPQERRTAVSFLGLVPPSELPALIAQHDIGLALEDKSIVNRDLTITNKILQYLNAGLFVIASDTAGQREVLANTAAGFVDSFADPAASAKRLDALLADRAALAAGQRAARQLAESHYSWEREGPRLIAHIEQALSMPPAA